LIAPAQEQVIVGSATREKLAKSTSFGSNAMGKLKESIFKTMRKNPTLANLHPLFLL